MNGPALKQAGPFFMCHHAAQGHRDVEVTDF